MTSRLTSRVTMVAIASLLVLSACHKPEPEAEPIRSVRVATLQPLSAETSLEFAGDVRPRSEVRLGFRVAGKIISRSVDLGDEVKAGQALAQLDSRDLKLGSQAAQASVMAARANFAQAQADYARFKELKDQGFISSAELERRDTTLKAAKAAFEQATSQASAVANQEGYAVLVADVAGVVTGVDAEPGQVVSAGSPVIRLAQDGARDVVFAVPEDKLDAFKLLESQGGNVFVSLWGNTATPIPAKVREVSASADPLTRTYLVKADLGASPVKLGQSATVKVSMGQIAPPASSAIAVPMTALFESEGKTSVWVFEPQQQTIRIQPVQVSRADDQGAIVTAGLQAGQQIVTAGTHVLRAGQKVKPLDTKNATSTDQGVAASAARASSR